MSPDRSAGSGWRVGGEALPQCILVVHLVLEVASSSSQKEMDPPKPKASLLAIPGKLRETRGQRDLHGSEETQRPGWRCGTPADPKPRSSRAIGQARGATRSRVGASDPWRTECEPRAVTELARTVIATRMFLPGAPKRFFFVFFFFRGGSKNIVRKKCSYDQVRFSSLCFNKLAITHGF